MAMQVCRTAVLFTGANRKRVGTCQDVQVNLIEARIFVPFNIGTVDLWHLEQPTVGLLGGSDPSSRSKARCATCACGCCPIASPLSIVSRVLAGLVIDATTCLPDVFFAHTALHIALVLENEQ